MTFRKTAAALILLAAATPAALAQEQPLGIPECDSFIANYQRCVSTQVPEAQRAMILSSVAQWRATWYQMAANPQTRGVLEQVCRQQVDSMREGLQAHGCRF